MPLPPSNRAPLIQKPKVRKEVQQVQMAIAEPQEVVAAEQGPSNERNRNEPTLKKIPIRVSTTGYSYQAQ